MRQLPATGDDSAKVLTSQPATTGPFLLLELSLGPLLSAGGPALAPASAPRPPPPPPGWRSMAPGDGRGDMCRTFPKHRVRKVSLPRPGTPRPRRCTPAWQPRSGTARPTPGSWAQAHRGSGSGPAGDGPRENRPRSHVGARQTDSMARRRKAGPHPRTAGRVDAGTRVNFSSYEKPATGPEVGTRGRDRGRGGLGSSVGLLSIERHWDGSRSGPRGTAA